MRQRSPSAKHLQEHLSSHMQMQMQMQMHFHLRMLRVRSVRSGQRFRGLE